MSTYPFGPEDFRHALEMSGRRVTGRRKLVALCLAHKEKEASMQVYPDGWCQCFAGCGRFHISNYFPELKDHAWQAEDYIHKERTMPKPVEVEKVEEEKEYKVYNLWEEWEKMREIPRDHQFKTLNLDVLDSMGWRWTDGIMGMGPGYFIPYFNKEKTEIPFAQVRHLEGKRRFSFLSGAKMIAYGKWNLYPGEKVFIVEGPSDCAVLEACMVPWIGIPSAANTTMLVNLVNYCIKNKIEYIYAGDNDEAGEKLRLSIDKIAGYRRCQPPEEYKDWGDYLVAKGLEVVAARLTKVYEEGKISPEMAVAREVFNIGVEKQGSLI